MSTPDSNDIFEVKLTQALESMQECQRGKNVESCYACSECVGCEIRTRYVRSVYESMSKGETGGFDF